MLPRYAHLFFFSVAAWGQATNYVASATYDFPGGTLVAPGQVITLFVRGLNVPNAVAKSIPLPNSLSGVSVVVTNAPTPGYPTSLPVFSVFSEPSRCAGGVEDECDTTAVTVQFPFEPTCLSGGVNNPCTGYQGIVKVAIQANGVEGPVFWFNVVRQKPHIVNTCDVLANLGRGGTCTQAVTHADGTMVDDGSLAYGLTTAHVGEVVTIWALGLGPTNHAKTGQAVAAADPASSIPLTAVFELAVPAGSAAPPPKLVPVQADYTGLVPGFVGLYQINVRLPDVVPNALQCQRGGALVRLFMGAIPADLPVNTADGRVTFSNTESAGVCIIP